MMEWISVEDRLPENDGWVIGWDGEDVDKIWYWAIEKEFDNGCGVNTVFTHWMPIPEPPQ